MTAQVAIAVPAGFGRRLAAYFIDCAILIILTLPYWVPGGVGEQMAPLWRSIVGLVLLVPCTAYFVVMDGKWGATIGKRAVGVRVRDVDADTPIGLPRGLIRTLGSLISAWAFYVGFLWMFTNERRQTWHDIFARSIVVRG
jgi:uncharacterized RDD family membrane protein YckC